MFCRLCYYVTLFYDCLCFFGLVCLCLGACGDFRVGFDVCFVLLALLFDVFVGLFSLRFCVLLP